MTYFPPAMAPGTLLILGPTAGGKTALALAIARQLRDAPAPGMPRGAECISADSMQVYRGMDIGTAKPTPAERAEVPHHMIDVADPHADSFTLADWLAGAQQAIAATHARGNLAIVVGGTSLYVKALLEGMFDAPPPDPELRARLEQEPTEHLRAQLERLDPVAAARIHPNDRRRAIRAIEVHQQTGQPISALQLQWQARPQPLPEGWHAIGLNWPVEAINQRINARVGGMMAAGFLEEVARLAAKGPLTRQAVEAVGYQELLAHLAGKVTLEEAVEAIKIRSRRYAKQQRTWLRRFQALPGSLWLDAPQTPLEGSAGALLAKIFGSVPR